MDADAAQSTRFQEPCYRFPSLSEPTDSDSDYAIDPALLRSPATSIPWAAQIDERPASTSRASKPPSQSGEHGRAQASPQGSSAVALESLKSANGHVRIPFRPPAAESRPSTPDKPSHTIRTKYTKEDLSALLHEVAEANPFSAPHRQKGLRWNEIHQNLRDAGHFTRTNMEGIKKKVNKIIAWHEEGAHELAETKKEESRQVEEDNRRGGEVIRLNSVRMKRKLASATEQEQDSPPTNKENLDRKDSPSPAKRRRVNSECNSDRMHQLLKEQASRNAAYQSESLELQRTLITEVRRGNEEYVRAQQAYLEVLRDKL
ncbi:hypothetical protein BN946_scf184969.g29 [Trametes cinnabarina]|uniref:Myb/SANT-like DNA-binding domain-containing protein n=1 Tax=Pycnoporus cinnabarinus TaxID=5643 RepID=A0A060SYP6_PYCCI|nr:hypothetical protein BN946_scf184969.g29 [Trametes cinnabarina]